MVLFTPSYMLVFFVFCIFVHFMDMAQSCDKDAHCKPHQVCCGKRCRSWPKCFLNSDKECYYDTHCIKGAVCVSNVCKPRKQLPTSCKTDEDCSFQKHSKSYDGIVSASKCCQGKCFKTKSCLALKINSTLTTPATSQAIGESQPCLETTNCPSELECIKARCTAKVVDSQKNTEKSDTTLSRAGFLSAAILTAAVFLAIMCFCFLKESKYAQRHYMHRARRGESLTQSTYSTAVEQPSATDFHDQPDQTHSSNSRNNNRAFQISASWILFPGLYGLSQTERSHGVQDRNFEQQEDCSSSCTRPPSYRSVCFDHELPPSYDEAMNCQHNITITAGSNIESDQHSASLA